MVPSSLWIFSEAVLPSRNSLARAVICALVDAVFDARSAPCFVSAQPLSVLVMW